MAAGVHYVLLPVGIGRRSYTDSANGLKLKDRNSISSKERVYRRRGETKTETGG